MVSIKDLQLERAISKKENTNPCFLKKKDNFRQKIFFVSSKKNIDSFKKFPFIARKNHWDKERKVFNIHNKSKKIKIVGIDFKGLSFFHFEDVFSNVFFSSKLHCFNSNLFYENFLEKLKFLKNFLTDFLVFNNLKKFGMSIQRFRLFENFFLFPNFLCWKKKKYTKTVFNLMVFKKLVSFNSSLLLSALLTKLKPISLKIALVTKSSVLFFSIDNGFSSTCPIFCFFKKKKKKVLYKKNKFFFSID